MIKNICSQKLYLNKKGFTVLEILVVLAIITALSSFILSSVSNARARTRDNVRKQTLVELLGALNAYAEDHNGQYPAANWYSSEPGDLVNNGYNNDGNWIPGLAPQYISKLPRDPLGKNGPSRCFNGVVFWQRAYIYYSDGSNFKLLNHCGLESVTGISNTDIMIDPTRDGGPNPAIQDGNDGWAWAVWSPGGVSF